MKNDYIKYRTFLRDFSRLTSEMDADTVYEIVGAKGITIGFFSLKNPIKES